MKTETLSSVWILLEDYAESRGSGLHMAANQLDRPQAGRTESYGSVEVERSPPKDSGRKRRRAEFQGI